MDRASRAKEIIQRTHIVTLATVSSDGEPRSTPVTAAWDERHVCYWTSYRDTEHSKNIRANQSIFISLFDPESPPLTASGVYIKAQATELTDADEIIHAARYVYSSKGKTPREASEFMGESIKRMYKAIPEQCWVSLREDYEVDPAASRKEITL
jgi:hypothetical protein